MTTGFCFTYDTTFPLCFGVEFRFPLSAKKGKGYKYRGTKDKENFKYIGTKGEDYKYKAKRQR